MTKQKLAKLPDIQTACLAHNAGWSVQVIHGKKHQPVVVNNLYLDKITGDYITGGFKVDESYEFYLHPRHNEALSATPLDITIPCVSALQKGSFPAFAPTRLSESAFNYDLNEFRRVVYRPDCPYFPKFEWVEV